MHIVGYTVGNVYSDARAEPQNVISERTSNDIATQMKKNECNNPHSNALLQFCLELERWKPHKAACHPTRCGVINDVRLFPTVYRRIHCSNFLDVIQSDVSLQNQVH